MKKRYSIFSLLCKNYLITILLVVGMNKLVFAQAIDFNLACPNPPVDLANQVVGTPFSVSSIGAVNAPGAVTMSIRSISVDGLGSFCAPCTSPLLLNGGPLTTDITFTVSSPTVSISTPGSGINPLAAGKVVHFTLRATAGGSQCDRTYNFKIIAPVSLMLVLDGSGSMAWGYDGNTSPPAGLRRWDGLKTGVGVMAPQIGGITLLDKDSLGLRLFSTGVIIPAAPFNGPNLVSMQTNSSQITSPSVLTADPPGGWTALGDGILAGTGMLHPGPASYNKAMIVFSDGIQNMGDLVKEVGTDAYKVTNLNKNISDGDKIKIYTIGLGSSGSLPATMSEIASKNGGAYLNADAGADFATFFTTQFTNIFAGRSPQLVDIKKSSFPVPAEGLPSTTEQSFSINKGVSSLIVTLLAPTSSEPRFTSFVKDGTDLIQYAQQSSGPGFHSITIKFPIKGLNDTTLNGEWKVRAQVSARPQSEIAYTLMILADDHIVHPEYSLGTGNFKIGDVLNPKLTLYQRGKPIANATVQAIVLRPGEDINDLLARSQVSFNVPPVDSASPDVAKLAVLLKDSNFVNKIKLQNQVFNLVYSASDSTYKGTFNGLTVSGVYQLFYLTSANDAEIGKIQRFQQMSFYVRFPDVDLANSNILVSSDPTTGKSILTARFITSQGKYIGSGWKSAINIDAAGLKIEKIDDIGDGTYRIYFNGELAGNGIISVYNDTIYNGNLANIGNGGSGGTGGGNEIWKHWWFWVLLLILIIIIISLSKKKKGP